MPNKTAANSKRPKPRPSRTNAVYASLSAARASAKKRAESERRRGVKPIDDYDTYLKEVTDFWPRNESIDEFITWLRHSRRTGRY